MNNMRIWRRGWRTLRGALISAPRRGQTLVEAGFVVTVLLLLTMGLVQFGLIFNAVVTLTHLTRDGTRYAAIHGREQTTNFNGAQVNTDDAIAMYIRQGAGNTSVQPGDLTITVSPSQAAPGQPAAAGRNGGMPITVTVAYDMHKKMFLPPSFPGLANYGASYPTEAAMQIE